MLVPSATHAVSIVDVMWSDDGRFIATADDNGNITLSDAESGVVRAHAYANAQYLAFDDSARFLYTMSDESVQVRDTAADRQVLELTLANIASGYNLSSISRMSARVAYVPEPERGATAHTLHVHGPAGEEARAPIEAPNEVSLVLAGGGSRLWVIRPNRIEVHDPRTLEILAEERRQPREDGFISNEDRVASIWENEIIVRRASDARELTRIPLEDDRVPGTVRWDGDSLIGWGERTLLLWRGGRLEHREIDLVDADTIVGGEVIDGTLEPIVETDHGFELWRGERVIAGGFSAWARSHDGSLFALGGETLRIVRTDGTLVRESRAGIGLAGHVAEVVDRKLVLMSQLGWMMIGADGTLARCPPGAGRLREGAAGVDYQIPERGTLSSCAFATGERVGGVPRTLERGQDGASLLSSDAANREAFLASGTDAPRGTPMRMRAPPCTERCELLSGLLGTERVVLMADGFYEVFERATARPLRAFSLGRVRSLPTRAYWALGGSMLLARGADGLYVLDPASGSQQLWASTVDRAFLVSARGDRVILHAGGEPSELADPATRQRIAVLDGRMPVFSANGALVFDATRSELHVRSADDGSILTTLPYASEGAMWPPVDDRVGQCREGVLERAELASERRIEAIGRCEPSESVSFMSNDFLVLSEFGPHASRIVRARDGASVRVRTWSDPSGEPIVTIENGSEHAILPSRSSHFRWRPPGPATRVEPIAAQPRNDVLRAFLANE